MRSVHELEQSPGPDRGVLVLSGNVDMSETLTLRDDLMRALAEGRAVAIDAGAVSRVGTPAIQVLLGGFRSAEAEGISFAISAASPVMRSAFEDLGLNNELNMMIKAVERRVSA